MPPLFALTMLLAAQGDDAAPPEEIVVTARPRGCDTSLNGRILSDSDFDAKARGWAAGKPVQVRARADTDLKCLTKIAFRLADRGVTRIQFVDPDGKPADLFPRGAGQDRVTPPPDAIGNGTGDAMRDREWRFLETRAAKLVLDGKCDEARRMLLEAGDLSGAADVVTVCKTQ